MIANRSAPSAAHLEEAADWMFHLQAAPGDSALRAEHARWLAADGSHAAAWLAVQRGWQVTGRLQPGPSAAIHPFAPPRQHGRWRHIGLAAAALAACLAVALILPGLLLHWRADQVTATAENRAVTLADGSTVTLGGDSAFVLHFTPAQRDVTLLRGEAHFQVAPDAARPFVIAAGPAQVIVVGTAFDVTMTPHSLVVAVASGHVQVKTDTAADVTHLLSGDRIEIDLQTRAARMAKLPPGDVGAWRENRLVVHDQPLRDVIAQLDRYHRGEILLLDDALDAALGRQRISGVFDPQEPMRALRAMLAAAGPGLRGVTLREITPYLIVINR